MKKQKKIAPKKASNKKKRKKTPRRKQKSTKIPQTIVSVIKGLEPIIVHEASDETSDDIINHVDDEWKDSVKSLIVYVKKKSEELVNDNKEKLNKILIDDDEKKRNAAPVGTAWRHKIIPDMSDYPKANKAVSRVQRLIQFNAITTYESYLKNTDKRKKEPTYPDKINLGAVDKQMAVLSHAADTPLLVLRFKCWGKDLKLVFLLPEYVFRKHIKKFNLPTIRLVDDEVVFDFSVEEYTKVRRHKTCYDKKIYAGIDLGRVKAYAMTIMNENKGVIAQYDAHGQAKFINDKRNRLLEESSYLYKKEERYKKLLHLADDIKVEDIEIPDNIGDDERLLYDRLIKLMGTVHPAVRASIRRLGRELALLVAEQVVGHLSAHGVDVLVMENLSWVSAAHGSSRWNFSDQQRAIEHACWREGIKVVYVSAAYSSQTCPVCGSREVSHDDGKRLTICKSCGHSGDRDFSASRVLGGGVASGDRVSRLGEVRVNQRVLCRVDHPEYFGNSVRSKGRYCDGLVFDGESYFNFWCPPGFGVRGGAGVVMGSLSSDQPAGRLAHTGFIVDDEEAKSLVSKLPDVPQSQLRYIKTYLNYNDSLCSQTQ